MKKLLIIACLLGIVGCEGNYDPVRAYSMFYQMEGRAPFTQYGEHCTPYTPIYPQWRGATEIRRQQEIDDMLWERDYGAPWPSMDFGY